jgi:primary-amine oxidase
LALCQYDVIGSDRVPSYEETVVDVEAGKSVKHHVVGKEHHAALTVYVAEVYQLILHRRSC